MYKGKYGQKGEKRGRLVISENCIHYIEETAIPYAMTEEKREPFVILSLFIVLVS
ncbi:hypothetical protein J2S74_004548 [Evansella vedderi]|uniref:Uncharacterized protein n=1 Tax=Evansella vedderi TaxID=38282 RepID=A0ABU0A0U1_9BACI|nr:hypothetical protein [Evansella vedderi]MDQ0257102.1 hypothetical protein [Evansella vedderi]